VVGTASTKGKREGRESKKRISDAAESDAGNDGGRWDARICAVRVRRENGGPKPRSTFVEAELFPELEALLCTESASLD